MDFSLDRLVEMGKFNTNTHPAICLWHNNHSTLEMTPCCSILGGLLRLSEAMDVAHCVERTGIQDGRRLGDRCYSASSAFLSRGTTLESPCVQLLYTP